MRSWPWGLHLLPCLWLSLQWRLRSLLPLRLRPRRRYARPLLLLRLRSRRLSARSLLLLWSRLFRLRRPSAYLSLLLRPQLL